MALGRNFQPAAERRPEKGGGHISGSIARGHMGLPKSAHLLSGCGPVLGPIPADAPCVKHGNRYHASGERHSRKDGAWGRILPVVLPLETRYAALRPVVYAYKDGGIFADTNYSALLEWNKTKQELEDIL